MTRKEILATLWLEYNGFTTKTKAGQKVLENTLRLSEEALERMCKERGII